MLYMFGSMECASWFNITCLGAPKRQRGKFGGIETVRSGLL